MWAADDRHAVAVNTAVADAQDGSQAIDVNSNGWGAVADDGSQAIAINACLARAEEEDDSSVREVNCP